MVYIQSWQDFQEAAEALYAKEPNKARYCVKWKGSEGRLVLKLTDDTTCLKYKTQSSIFLNRFDALNKSLMRKMQNVQSQPQPLSNPLPNSQANPLLNPQAQAQASHPSLSAGDTGGTPTPTPVIGGSSPAGGVKKKKGKKKK